MSAEALARIDAVLFDLDRDYCIADEEVVTALREARDEIDRLSALVPEPPTSDGASLAEPLVVREFLSGGLGYVIRRTGSGAYFWEWLEPGEPIDVAESDYATELGAIEAALRDWETNGTGKIWAFVGDLEAARDAEADRA